MKNTIRALDTYTHGATITTGRTAITASGAVTLTPEQCNSGVVAIDPGGAARNVTLPSFSDLSGFNGGLLSFTLLNTADAAEVLTVVAGTDCTVIGNPAIGQSRGAQITIVWNATTTAVVFVEQFDSQGLIVSDSYTEITASGAVTLTAAQIATGSVVIDPGGSGRNVTTPTLAQMSTLGHALVSFQLTNTADAAETLTVVAGSGYTVKGTATVAQNQSARVTLVRISSSAGLIFLDTNN